jgi:hypothetical protein
MLGGCQILIAAMGAQSPPRSHPKVDSASRQHPPNRREIVQTDRDRMGIIVPAVQGALRSGFASAVPRNTGGATPPADAPLARQAIASTIAPRIFCCAPGPMYACGLGPTVADLLRADLPRTSGTLAMCWRPRHDGLHVGPRKKER